MHMKKAVTLIKSFLKFTNLKKKDELQTVEPEEEWSKPQFPEVTIFKPCNRCVLVYENKLWTSLQRELLQQEYYELESDGNNEIQSKTTESRTASAERNRVRGLLRYYGLVNPILGKSSLGSDESCMSTACLQGHTIWRGKYDQHEPHYPTFVFMTRTQDNWLTPLEYADADFILLRISLVFLRSILDCSLQASGVSVNAEVWVLMSKFRPQSVSLAVEENMLFQYLDNFVFTVFLDLPSSRETRTNHLEALFQAVDNILDISLYITLTSGIPPENQSFIKDTIIETATVMTSTAAESTATVGIETAAMAMGQAAAGVALSILVDVAITAGIVTRAKIQRDKGVISQKQFQTTVRHKLCDSGCQFVGGTTGTIVGQILIPVPIVGAIVGGFCGSLIGAGVSKGIIKTSEIISKAQATRLKAITEK